VMAEIRQFYEELNKFWREEICCVVEALKKRRVDPRDFERWNGFRSSLKQTIEFWKVTLLPSSTTLHSQPIKYYVQNRPPGGDTQTLPSINTSSTVRQSLLPLWCFFRLTVCRELTLGQ
jgi:hypothetical protein